MCDGKQRTEVEISLALDGAAVPVLQTLSDEDLIELYRSRTEEPHVFHARISALNEEALACTM